RRGGVGGGAGLAGAQVWVPVQRQQQQRRGTVWQQGGRLPGQPNGEAVGDADLGQPALDVGQQRLPGGRDRLFGGQGQRGGDALAQAEALVQRQGSGHLVGRPQHGQGDGGGGGQPGQAAQHGP